jgi:hypothetical protein
VRGTKLKEKGEGGYLAAGVLVLILIFNAMFQSMMPISCSQNDGQEASVTMTDPLEDLIHIYTGLPAEIYFDFVDVESVKLELSAESEELGCTVTVRAAPPDDVGNATIWYGLMLDENNNSGDNSVDYPMENIDTMYTVIYNKVGGWTIERAKYQVSGNWWIVEDTGASFGLASSMPGGFSVDIRIPLEELPELADSLPFKVMTEVFTYPSTFPDTGDFAPDEGLAYLEILRVLPVIIRPSNGTNVYSNTEIVVTELKNPDNIIKAIFQYSADGIDWVLIGIDDNGTTVAKATDRVSYQWGIWTANWMITLLSEGWYYLRVTMVDKDLSSGQTQARVYVDPTPPLPVVVTPNLTDGLWVNVTLVANFNFTTVDENVVSVKVEYLKVPTYYNKSIPKKNQHDYGPLKGYAKGSQEWNDDTSCGPTSAGSCFWYFATKYPGIYGNLTKENGKQLNQTELIDRLHNYTQTVERSPKIGGEGVGDGNMENGLKNWIRHNGGCLTVEYVEKENFTFKKYATELLESQDLLVSTSTHWMVGNSVNFTQNADGTHTVDFMDPWTGEYIDVRMSNDGNFTVYGFNKDTMFVICPCSSQEVINWTLIGTDTNKTDGWNISWNVKDFTPCTSYLIRVTMTDANNRTGVEKLLVHITSPTLIGDINGDGTVDIYDAIMLANAYNSIPIDPRWNPKADMNNDNIVDIFDAIILANNYGRKA